MKKLCIIFVLIFGCQSTTQKDSTNQNKIPEPQSGQNQEDTNVKIESPNKFPAFNGNGSESGPLEENFCDISHRSDHFIYGKIISVSMVTSPFIVRNEENRVFEWGTSVDVCINPPSPSLELAVENDRDGLQYEVFMGPSVYFEMDPMPLLSDDYQFNNQWIQKDPNCLECGGIDVGEKVGVFIKKYSNQYMDDQGNIRDYVFNYQNNDIWYLADKRFFAFDSEGFLRKQDNQSDFDKEIYGMNILDIQNKFENCNTNYQSPKYAFYESAENIFPLCYKK